MPYAVSARSEGGKMKVIDSVLLMLSGILLLLSLLFILSLVILDFRLLAGFLSLVVGSWVVGLLFEWRWSGSEPTPDRSQKPRRWQIIEVLTLGLSLASAFSLAVLIRELNFWDPPQPQETLADIALLTWSVCRPTSLMLMSAAVFCRREISWMIGLSLATLVAEISCVVLVVLVLFY
jgi:uncharacterized membrane-anchored protein